MSSSIRYPNLPPPSSNEAPAYTEYTPLVNDRYFFVYRHNDSFVERLRRAVVFILLTLLLSLIFFSLLSMLLSIIAIGDQPYSYFLFTKRWPVAECKAEGNKCVPDLKPYNRWLIHGLWPEFSNNTWDQYCTKVKFNETMVDSLKVQLTKEWPNLLRDQTEDSLWAHEWNKHGTCSKLVQFDYFARTLALQSKYNLDLWLAEDGIVPSNTKLYSVSEFKHSIGKRIPRYNFELNCEHLRGKLYLKEIYLCVSFSDAQTLVPCTVETTCHEDFYYAALDNQ